MISLTALLTTWFGASVFGFSIVKIVSWIKWAVIAIVLSAITFYSYKFYSHYTGMSKTIATQEQKLKDNDNLIGSLKRTNKELADNLETKKQSADITEKAVSDNANKNLKETEKFNTIVKDRVEKETKLREKPIKRVTVKDSVTNKDTVVEKPMSADEVNQQISEIRIDSVWQTYCNSNKPSDSTIEICKSYPVI